VNYLSIIIQIIDQCRTRHALLACFYVLLLPSMWMKLRSIRYMFVVYYMNRTVNWLFVL